jgi:hypothetical protein
MQCFVSNRVRIYLYLWFQDDNIRLLLKPVREEARV